VNKKDILPMKCKKDSSHDRINDNYYHMGMLIYMPWSTYLNDNRQIHKVLYTKEWFDISHKIYDDNE